MKIKPPAFPFQLAVIFFFFFAQLFLIAPLLIANASPTSTITVNTSVDENVNNLICSLREAIIAANTNAAYRGCSAGAAGADTIVITATGTIPLVSYLPAVTETLTINGPAGGITIDGGGVYQSGFTVDNNATLTVSGLTFDRGNVGSGGAIYLSPGTNLYVSNSTFSNGFGTGSGGAIYALNETGTVSIDSSTFYSNVVTTAFGNLGGAIYSRGTLSITNSTFYSNTANGDVCCSGGGAIYGYTGTVMITNSTFVSNTSICCGGVIYTSFARASIFNSTLANNSAGCCGGATFVNSPLTATNTIIASNTPNNCNGGITNGGYNIDSAADCAFGSNNGSMSNTDPKLRPLANNGGSTKTMALGLNSPAIDAIVGNVNCPPTDQRGVHRPTGLRCDIGAYEATIATLFLPFITR